MTFNINAKALNDAAVLHLVDPGTGEYLYEDEAQTKPLTIDLYGKTSKQFRNWASTKARKNDQERKKNRGELKNRSDEEQIAETAEFLAAVSIKANNFDDDGEAINNKEAFIKLYSKPELSWIGEQVAEALGDVEAFMKK